MKTDNERKMGALLSYVSIIVNVLTQIICTPFLIRYLGQSEYGLYSLVSSIIGYLTVLDLGFGNAIIVYTAKYKAENKIHESERLHGMFKVIFIIIGIVAAILGLMLYFLAPFFFSNSMTAGELYKLKLMLLVLSFNLFITFSFNIYSSIITAYEKFIYQKIIAILSCLIKPILMIILLFIGFKSISLVLVITLINILVCLSNYYYCKNKLKIKVKFKGFDKLLFKVIFSYSFFIFLGVIVDKINWSVDQFVLGAVSGTAAVSLYTVASTVNNLFVNLSSTVSNVLLPKISKMVAKSNDNTLLNKEFIKIGRIQFFIIFFMESCLVLFGKEFFIIWAGKDYVNSYYIALILTIPLTIPLVQSLGISIMQAKNMHKFRSVLYAIIAFCNILISIPLAMKFEGIGSAIGTALSLLIGNGIIINIYYHKKVKLDVLKFWKEILKMFIPLTIPFVFIYILSKLVEVSGLLYLIIYAIIYGIAYFIISYFVVMNEYEKNLIVNPVFNKILKR